jgi:heme exporter protein C
MAFNLHRFANPGRFLRLATALLPWLSAGAATLFAIGLYLGLIGSPPDYLQGNSARIMYVHVPAAWIAMVGYAIMAAGGASALIWRHPLADVASEAIAPVGAAFTFVALATGSLWGKPTWGTYWEWDARLTSFLMLFFLYVGHIALTHAFDDRSRGRRSAAILAIVGVINLPIIKFSVDWWNTLHQSESVIRADGPSIDPAMLWPLFTMALAYLLYFLAVVMARMKAMLLEARHRAAAFARQG